MRVKLCEAKGFFLIKTRSLMLKKYVVRLSEDERKILQDTIKRLKGGSQKVRRAQILLKSDVEGPSWTDQRIAEAFDCTRQSIELIRERLVTEGFEQTLNGKRRLESPRRKILSGEQEAKVIAMRLGAPPSGYGSWSLRLLSDRVVELEIAETISYETVRS